jgi:hypothetical protein
VRGTFDVGCALDTTALEDEVVVLSNGRRRFEYAGDE